MDFLHSQFEAARTEYGNDAFMAPCVEAGWAKLDAYYTLTERSSAYVAAIVLSPHPKWHYFDIAWEDHPEWIESSKIAVESLWKSRYASVSKSATLVLGRQATSEEFVPCMGRRTRGF